MALIVNVSCQKDNTEEPKEEVVPVDTGYISN
jgi:hypothetical protein